MPDGNTTSAGRRYSLKRRGAAGGRRDRRFDAGAAPRDSQHDYAGEDAAGNCDSDGDEHPGGFRRREGLRPHRAGGMRRADADGRGWNPGGDGIKREEQRVCKLRSMRRRKSAAARGLTMCLCWRGLGEALILRRDRINALWVLPEGLDDARPERRRKQPEAPWARHRRGGVRRLPAVAYGVTDEKGRRPAAFAMWADVRDWPDEALDEARAFDRSAPVHADGQTRADSGAAQMGGRMV